jgi:O-succinylbenzoic acid--CoA ligase
VQVECLTHDPLTHRAASTPDRTALVETETGETWTYRDLDGEVDGTAAALGSLTAGDGQPRVGTLLGTRVAFVRLLFATMRLGGTLVPLNVRQTPGELRDQADRADLDLLVCGANTEDTAVDVGSCPVVSVDEPTTPDVLQLDPVDDPAVEPATLTRETEVLVLFTSGTSGRPKGVRLTVGNLVASATASAFRLGITPDDRWLCTLPTSHMGGLAPVLRSTLYGTTVVLQSSFDAERTAAVIHEQGVTGVSLVPTMLARLLDAGFRPPDHLRFVLLGGAAAPPDLVDHCRERDVPVCPTYGTTETASQVATARLSESFTYEGTVGQPLFGMEVTILDEEGVPCGPGERGELVVEGPTVTPGYLDDERTTAAFRDDGGFRTGDLASQDADGRLWIHGRVDDRIVTGGEVVDPAEVVAVIRDHPAVADAAVVGVDDPEWGQRVAAVIEPAGDVTAAIIDSHCRERLAGYKVPRQVAFVDALPRTPSGTVDRDRVRDLLD